MDSFDSSCNCYGLDKACIYDIVGDGSCDGTNVEQYLAGVEVGTVEHCSGDQACIVERCAEEVAHGSKASKRAVPRDAMMLSFNIADEWAVPRGSMTLRAGERAVPRESTTLHFTISDR